MSAPDAPRPARPDAIRRPHPSRLDPNDPRSAAALVAHRRAVDLGLDTYRDPTTGYQVMTAASLLARGACCDRGCRHCPWVGVDG